MCRETVRTNKNMTVHLSGQNKCIAVFLNLCLNAFKMSLTLFHIEVKVMANKLVSCLKT